MLAHKHLGRLDRLRPVGWSSLDTAAICHMCTLAAASTPVSPLSAAVSPCKCLTPADQLLKAPWKP